MFGVINPQLGRRERPVATFKVYAMKNAIKIVAFLTYSVFVTVPQAQPESDIATPIERAEITQNAPDLEQKQKEDWFRLREERKLARQQILSDIKANKQFEIRDFQQSINQQKSNIKAQNENKANEREPFFNKDNGPRENGPDWEKFRHENPPFDTPRPGERGPKYPWI